MAEDGQDRRGGQGQGVSAVQGPGHLLWQAVNRWQRRQKRVLTPFGLTPVQFILLAGLQDLAAQGVSPVTQSVLAKHCRTDPMMTSQVLRALEKRRLVERRTDKSDGRAMALAATDAGAKVAREAGAAVDTAQTAFFAALGDDVTAFGDALTLLMGERPRRRVAARRG